MSQRAKASVMCSNAGYARGGMARPAKGPRRPPASKPVAGPSQMPSDLMGAPPQGAAPAPPPDAGAGLMRRGGIAKARK